MKFSSRIGVAVLLLASSSQASELVHLSNGSDLRCAHHEQIGNSTRLYLDENAFVDMPSQQISGYEADPDPVAPPPIPFEPSPNIGNGVPVNASSLSAVSLDVPHVSPTVRDQVEQAARKTGVDPDFIESVIRIESGYNATAVSPKGARGLMQLMPSTAASLGVQDCFNPVANIDGGSRYLRDLLDRFDGDAIKALAAYNSGPERVEQYKGVPPFRETRSYVARVIKDFNRRKLSISESAVKRIGSSKQAKVQSTQVGPPKASSSEVIE